MQDTILSVDRLTVRFDASPPLLQRLLTGAGRRAVHAVEEVDFEIGRGSTFALVGESGCGKSTIARTIAGIQPPTTGAVSFMGVDISGFRTRHAALPYRRNLQMIFQDPYASLNPRWRVGRIVAEPILTHKLMTSGAALTERIAELLSVVGLSPADARKFPHQFSGGQRQRISIARALASNPAFIVCDEPTSALDVSVQAQILNLMKKLQRELGLTYLLISHNLAVVAHMADRMGVMYLGRLVEQGDAGQILERPLHPYTRLLLDTVPDPRAPNRSRARLSGEVPSPLAPPSGCAFHPRCPLANERCSREPPQPIRVGAAWVSCHAVEEGRLPSPTRENDQRPARTGDAA
ncbi:ATP-binding cassette domain-containing protein [Ancylobacter sp. MQZ15Z-1]|uniref:ATP-binding cassette domain-containing protein n=2 Tax=Ancylobacter mangrovi TaxID=2972472 RepID=A0A9X2PCU9_9HYPH|nr:oligopeptide/dipeptide ABC transporter ATP-binding protein [Ancylobacter mangrovi]MCS0494551.1 ATP-binding cassette domain-containing protein [Ancylobacter mangrovi]